VTREVAMQAAIDKMLGTLAINRSYLAGMLGVSERTLVEWRNRTPSELPPKARRLLRLIEVIEMIEKSGAGKGVEILRILQNGRVPLGGEDEDTGSVSLVGYINAFPEDGGWRANVSQAVEEFGKQGGSMADRGHARS
jgi:hypothetical protein